MTYLSILVRTILIIIIIIITFLLCRFTISNNKEKRISRFAINPLNDKQISIIDKLDKLIDNIIKSISNYLEKNKLFKLQNKRYEKYLGLSEKNRTSYDYISIKILISIMTTILTIISDALRLKSILFIQVFISFILGYYFLDIILIIKQKKKKKDTSNELLKAVVIMNNAFKSGRSIMQAVELVSNELDSNVGNEFKKIYIDLSYGLDLEVVFDRFSKRLPYDEVKYMASSLIILNKTGGNVIKVFSSIEKSFINRKRLNDELNSTLAMSNFVFRLLAIMPFIIFIVIYLFNNSYFIPLFNNPYGRIILLIICLLYISYILIIKKITKLKE